MASMITTTTVSSSHQKTFLIPKKPNNNIMLLKDYLKDDFSSCSSNGFKSFPRRQCCSTTVRFLLEIDLNTTNSNYKPRQRKQQRSNTAKPSTFSAFQKAVINAVKLLPFPRSSKSSSSTTTTTSPTPSKLFLPRSFSRKLFRRSFRRKIEHKKESGGDNGGGGEIIRCKSFHEFLKEKNDSNSKRFINERSTSSSSNSNSNSWSESEFSGNSESYSVGSGNDAVEGKNNLPNDKKVSDEAGVTVASKEWASEEDKEQFSPVSVLDCPFKDEEEEEEISSPFQRRLDRMKGAKQKLLKKIRSFESLAQLQPVNLEKKIELVGLEENETIKSPVQDCSISIDVKEETAQQLLKSVRSIMPLKNLRFMAEGLLLDFFRESILEKNTKSSSSKEFRQGIEVVQDWINGCPQELFLGWEVKDSRYVYLKDMEGNRNWRNLNEEKEELILHLELEVFTSLVNEALFDLLC